MSKLHHSISSGLALMACLLGIWGAPAHATAQTSPNRCPIGLAEAQNTKDALALTMHGIACFERGEFGAALSFYRKAYVSSQEPLLEAAIGRSLHELGMLGAAKVYYDLYLDHEQADVDGRKRIEERLERLNEELKSAARIKVHAYPGIAKVYIETKEGHRELVGQTPMEVALEPKEYNIVLEQDRFYPVHASVAPGLGEVVELSKEMIPQRATFNATTRTTRSIGSFTALAGIPIVVTGLTMRVLNRPFSRRRGNAVMLVGGATLLVGGGVYLLGLQREKKLRLNSKEVTLTTTVNPAQASIHLTW